MRTKKNRSNDFVFFGIFVDPTPTNIRYDFGDGVDLEVGRFSFSRFRRYAARTTSMQMPIIDHNCYTRPSRFNYQCSRCKNCSTLQSWSQFAVHAFNSPYIQVKFMKFLEHLFAVFTTNFTTYLYKVQRTLYHFMISPLHCNRPMTITWLILINSTQSAQWNYEVRNVCFVICESWLSQKCNCHSH